MGFSGHPRGRWQRRPRVPARLSPGGRVGVVTRPLPRRWAWRSGSLGWFGIDDVRITSHYDGATEERAVDAGPKLVTYTRRYDLQNAFDVVQPAAARG